MSPSCRLEATPRSFGRSPPATRPSRGRHSLAACCVHGTW
jgi:hypothetical protein